MSQKNGDFSFQANSCLIMKEHRHDYIILYSIGFAKKKPTFLCKQLGEQMPELHVLNANVQHNA